MVDHYCRKTCFTFFLAGGLLTSTVSAQPGNRVELLVGAGNAWTPECSVNATAMTVCDVYSLELYEIGATIWWSDYWGVAWRYEFNPREYFPQLPPFTSYGVDPFGRRNTRGHAWTVRRRWFRDGAEFDLGLGMGGCSMISFWKRGIDFVATEKTTD